MNETHVRLLAGSLLHDIGKICYRSGDGRNHSESGYDYLKNTAHIDDSEILACVRYHHAANLRHAKIADDSLAYLTYFADNIAAAADRREKEDAEQGFDRSVPLSTVFNVLNGNHGTKHYAQQVLDVKGEINYPSDQAITLDDSFYTKIITHITDNLRGIRLSTEYINSLLTILEANTSYIPSSTSRRELADISFFDHVKMTAAIAACMQQVLEERGETNYKRIFLDEKDQAYREKWFLLYSMDISGIQNFIYSIGTDGALKGLRARSFYLELMMEHIIDGALEACGLSRANLLYAGGGHCYLLLPNTKAVADTVRAWKEEVNSWLMDHFGIALYVAAGSTACSSMDFHNEPAGSYGDMFHALSRTISMEKANRYSSADIISLNTHREKGDRECRICRRMETLNAEGKCSLCAALEATSADILYGDYYAIVRGTPGDNLPLPGNCSMAAVSPDKLKQLMLTPEYVRSYTKNELYSGQHVTTKLLVGSYTAGRTFEQFASDAQGIDRIAVLRADVDNLGSAFVSGFPEEYASLSRTAAFSRQLSLFFKGYINRILSDGQASSLSPGGKRNVSIVYSGGDDVFLVGAWNEVIDTFTDIHNALTLYTDGTLKISGGIGLYPGKYPIHLMAQETEALEAASKGVDGKDAITVFDPSGAYPWSTFTEEILGKKYLELKRFFDTQEERGMAFLYHLLDLIRNSQDKIQFARYIYLLSRMEPDAQNYPEENRSYRVFLDHMVRWYRDGDDRRQLSTAIYLYVYQNRGGNDV